MIGKIFVRNRIIPQEDFRHEQYRSQENNYGIHGKHFEFSEQ